MKSAWLFVGLSCLVSVSAVSTEATAESDFKVTLLGTASPAPRPTRYGPSTLVEVGGPEDLALARRRDREFEK